MANPDEHVGKSWYLGKISKEKSRELLETFGEEGDYIVRDSETRAGVFVCEVKGGPLVRRFRIFKDDSFYVEGRNSNFSSLENLLKFYACYSPALDGGGALLLRKPLKIPKKRSQTPMSSETSGSLRGKITSLQKLVTETETRRVEIREKYLEEQVEKIGTIIPPGKSFQMVWQKEKETVKRSYRRRDPSADLDINKVEPSDKVHSGHEEEAKQNSNEQLDTEKRIMQTYVDIIGRNIELKISVKEHLYLNVRMKAVYDELKNDIKDTMREYHKNTKDLEEKFHILKEMRLQDVNVKQEYPLAQQLEEEILAQKELRRKISEFDELAWDMVTLSRNTQMLYKNIKNESQKWKVESEKQCREQWKLRYMPNDLECMYQILSLVTKETDKEMEDVEHLLNEATETEEEIGNVLELNRSHRESFEAMWQNIQREVGLRQQLLETRDLVAPLASLCEGISAWKPFRKGNEFNGHGTYSALMTKGFTRYSCVRAHGNGATLQAPGSAVQLLVPEDLNVLVMGHAHTDVKQFLQVVPENECFVSPVAEYHCTFKEAKRGWFCLRVPHCVKNRHHLKHIRVRHGDTHKNIPFEEVPRVRDNTSGENCYFEVNENHITIHTTHFSQFVCSICKKVCCGDGKAFVFGGLSPIAFAPPLTAAVRLYVCSPLFRIEDYRMKLISVEERYKRHLIVEDDVVWTPKKYKASDLVLIKLRSAKWNPRLPIKSVQKWDESVRELTHRKKISEMSDMLFCHSCKIEPSTVAHFDFQYPACSVTGKALKDLAFVGYMKMFLKSAEPILETHIDIYPDEATRKETNKYHRILRDITKMIICTIPEAHDFGLSLGFTCGEITQKLTNFCHSVEMAGWSLACEWWDSSPRPDHEKSQFLLEAVRYLGKGQLEGQIREKLPRGIQEEETREIHNGGTEGGQEELSTRSRDTEEEDRNEGNGTVASGIAHTTGRKYEKFEMPGGKKKFLPLFRKKVKSDTCESKGVTSLDDLATKDREIEKFGNGENPKRRMNKYTPMKVVYARNQSAIPSKSIQQSSPHRD